MLQEFGAWSLKRTMANSTDFQTTFGGGAVCAAARQGNNSMASTAPSRRGVASAVILTFGKRFPAVACSTREGSPSWLGLFSFVASLQTRGEVYDRWA